MCRRLPPCPPQLNVAATAPTGTVSAGWASSGPSTTGRSRPTKRSAGRSAAGPSDRSAHLPASPVAHRQPGGSTGSSVFVQNHGSVLTENPQSHPHVVGGGTGWKPVLLDARPGLPRHLRARPAGAQAGSLCYWMPCLACPVIPARPAGAQAGSLCYWMLCLACPVIGAYRWRRHRLEACATGCEARTAPSSPHVVGGDPWRPAFAGVTYLRACAQQDGGPAMGNMSPCLGNWSTCAMRDSRRASS